jgi:peptidyl-tRNA hydrolase
MPAFTPVDDADDPWVLYLVVRKEAGLGFGDMLAATASACVRCADRYEQDPRYEASFRGWYQMAVRKVTLRANEREWHRLRDELDVALAAPRGTVHAVAALPPRRRSEREKLLVQMQALTAMPDELPPSAPPAGGLALPLVINADAGMSSGKACAQAAHASLHAARSPLAQNPFLEPTFDAWKEAGRPVRVRLARRAVFDRLAALPSAIVIHDAGFTELQPGTATALALPPLLPEQEPPALLEAAPPA